MALIGKAPLTTCRTSQGFVQVYAGQPVPADILKEDAERLVREGYLVEVAPSKADGDTDGDTDGATKEPSVKEVEAQVGDDAEKAQAALDAENAREKGPRATLVKSLEAVIKAATESGSNGTGQGS